jgi:hypothetical protein
MDGDLRPMAMLATARGRMRDVDDVRALSNPTARRTPDIRAAE